MAEDREVGRHGRLLRAYDVYPAGKSSSGKSGGKDAELPGELDAIRITLSPSSSDTVHPLQFSSITNTLTPTGRF